MSIFGKIRQSRKAAKEHKEKAAEKETVVVVPYKHIPTHAAVDALSGAPSTWKQDDRQKIKEHHNRRSQMGFSRTGSSLSTVSYMNNTEAGPSTPGALNRNSSYVSYNPNWFDRSDQYHNDPSPQRRSKTSRIHSYHDSGIAGPSKPSPLGSSSQSDDEVSPLGSSGNSTTSDSSDPLEMPTASGSERRKSIPLRSTPIVYKEKDIFDRLHTSTTRKLGEAPLYDSPPVTVKGPMASLPTKEVKVEKRARWSLMGKKPTSSMAN